MIEVGSNTTKVVEHTPARLDSLDSNMPPSVVADEVAQLCNNVDVILEKRNILLNEMDLRFSTDAG